MTAAKIEAEPRPVTGTPRLEFAAVYRENIGPVTAFFARRCRDPQQVADLTSQTFVEAIKSAHTFQGRGTPRAWLIAIARRVYAGHRAEQAIAADLLDQLGGRLVLSQDDVEDLAARIDAQREGQRLLVRADGSVSITVHELASAIPQLNAEFARRGINETVVPVTAKCRPSREFRLQAYPTAHMTDTWTFTPAYSARTPGCKGVLAAEQLPNGEVAVAQMVVPEPVPSCFSNAAYTLRLTGKTNHGVPMATETRVFPATPAHAGG
jgi:DNA-directed RNA polymerase specialized sigma24 family protein